jgi:hypothetical protein
MGINNFLGGWQGIRFRFRAAFENAQSCMEAMALPGPKPKDQQYEEEQTLSELFTLGLSAIESFCFCLYFAGAASSAQANFPHIAAPHKIRLSSTLDAFQNVFPADRITTEIAAFDVLDEQLLNAAVVKLIRAAVRVASHALGRLPISHRFEES